MPGKNRSTAKPANGGYSLGPKKDSGLTDVELPSGHTIQARRPGVQGLIAAGLLDNFDELTSLVHTEHINPKTARGAAASRKVSATEAQKAAEALVMDRDKLSAAFLLMDRLAAHVIVQPAVWVDYQLQDEPDEKWETRKREAEEAGAYPIREVDMDDKMFLLNWAVGGSADLAAFRDGTNELLGNLAAS